MKRFDTELVSRRPLARDYFELRFQWPWFGPSAGASSGLRNPVPASGLDPNPIPGPGTFLTIRTGGQYDPVLRRPFALSDYDASRNEAAVIFQKRGRGTTWLAGLEPGARLDILGPLGKGFSPPPRGSRPVLVAGGIGLGPVLYLARVLAEQAAAGHCEAPLTVFGFRSVDFVPKSIDFPASTVICTDDGSAGFHGTVLDWLRSADTGLPPAYYGCGPLPMMAALDRLAGQRGAPFQAAVEQWMACGIGACAGCVVTMKDGSYIKACVDGPVVDGCLVNWEA
ncbi:MAG: dihydroorotate dehydrogenase electron transfer subunit [Spirochaetota bacterium]